MKSFLLSTLLSFSYFFAKAQETTLYYDYKWNVTTDISLARYFGTIQKTDSGYVKKDYFVSSELPQMIGKYSDQACKTKDGYFYWFHANKRLSRVARYVDGKREGSDIGFHFNGMMSDSTNYIDGVPMGISLSWHYNGFPEDSITYHNDGTSTKVSWHDNGNTSQAGRLDTSGKFQGKWQFFDSQGNLAALETYEHGVLKEALVYSKDGSTEKNLTSIEIDAELKHKNKTWKQWLDTRVEFPRGLLLKNAKIVTIRASFEVNHLGEVQNVNITLPFHPQFDAVLKRAIENSPKWQPKIAHNRAVKSFFVQDLGFTMSDE